MWQTIDSAPKDGTQVLLWCDNYGVEIGSYRNDMNDDEGDDPCWLDNSHDDFSCGYASTPLSPTHWMPLPEGPN